MASRASSDTGGDPNSCLTASSSQTPPPPQLIPIMVVLVNHTDAPGEMDSEEV